METVPIKTSTRASKDIDPATLHRLYHEEHMTIKAIAELCGICTATVRRYLGPVKRGRRMKQEPAPPRAVVAEVVKAPAPQPKRLQQSKTELRGATATFEIDHESCMLLVRGSTFELIMGRGEVEQFIWELVEAYETLPKEKTEADDKPTEEGLH